MRRRIVIVVAVLAAASAVLLPAALAQSSPSSAASSGQKIVLRVGEVADMNTDNPFAVSGGSDWTAATIQYDMLLKFSDQDLTAAPSLATGCDHSADYMTWTCTLRPGLKWSDGTPLTSEDVAFTYRFVMQHKFPQYISYFPFHPVFSTPNDTTLVWKADRPTFAPSMPPWVYIVPEHVWSKYQDADLKTIKNAPNTPSVASGPFTLTSWTRGQGWTMDRNPYYWGTAPTVDEIQFRVYTNQESMIQALKNGEIDFADGIKSSLLASVQGTPNVTTQQVVSDWWLNFAFNFGGQGPQAHPLPALHDLTVRKAIEMAIDKQAIVEKVYNGTATPGDTVVRPASTYWHLDIPADQEFPFDPAAANAMLQNAGYVDTNGDGIREDPTTHQPLVLNVPASTDTIGAEQAGELIVGFLKDIGIEVNLEPVNDGKMGDFWASGNFDAYIWYWSGDPDPNYQLSVFTSGQCGGWSDGCWKDPAYDRLYEEQRGIMDPAKRLPVVQEAQRYLYEHIPGVVLAYPGWLQAYRSDRFTGWVPAPGPHGYLMPGYNYDSLVSVHPVAGADISAGSPGLPGWLWGVLIVVIIAATVLLLRRRRGVDEEEA
ncbi:MAG TPA: peptide ABC transporter substrate-binding protein [Actinomycetota bacterium]|nr:peptide ABC transporter substrate-binding protein [Actinomycetota bacterium]